MRFFTICSNNYLANAITLGDQLAKFHTDSDFTIFLADKPIGYDPEIVPHRMIPMEKVGLIDERGMITRYNISELNTAIKPFCFSYLFRESEEPVVYIDPDIYPVSPLDEVVDALVDHNAVLTPHILHPVEHGGFRTEEFLRLGIYNLGFLALASCPSAHDFLTWWSEKLEKDCVIDIPRGIFVDQKWADFVPSFVDNTKILRHPGYNVAYWNLHNRTITRGDSGYLANNLPLRFVHFSGLPSDDSDAISKRYTPFTSTNTPVLGEILTEYRQQTEAAGAELFGQLEFSYFISPNGENLHAPELEVGGGRAERGVNTYLPNRMLRTIVEYDEYLQTNRGELERRRQTELDLLADHDDLIAFDGYDYTLGTRATFRTGYQYAYETGPAGQLIPNWREHVAAEGGYCNRIRAFIHLFFQEFQPRLDSNIYMTEQATDLYRWMKTRFPHTEGSEYLGPEYQAGQIVNDLRNENVEQLSFADDQFDFALSLDVFEHVAYYEQALAEVLRVLKPGGFFVFGIPTNGMDVYDHELRAVIEDNGSITHLMEPEFHGNPVDEDGALCFRYYGWKLLDEMRELGFLNPFVFRYWSDTFGYLGPNQMLFVGQKPA